MEKEQSRNGSEQSKETPKAKTVSQTRSKLKELQATVQTKEGESANDIVPWDKDQKDFAIGTILHSGVYNVRKLKGKDPTLHTSLNEEPSLPTIEEPLAMTLEQVKAVQKLYLRIARLDEEHAKAENQPTSRLNPETIALLASAEKLNNKQLSQGPHSKTTFMEISDAQISIAIARVYKLMKQGLSERASAAVVTQRRLITRTSNDLETLKSIGGEATELRSERWQKASQRGETLMPENMERLQEFDPTEVARSKSFYQDLQKIGLPESVAASMLRQYVPSAGNLPSKEDYAEVSKVFNELKTKGFSVNEIAAFMGAMRVQDIVKKKPREILRTQRPLNFITKKQYDSERDAFEKMWNEAKTE